VILTRRMFVAFTSTLALATAAGLSPFRLIGSALAQDAKPADLAVASPLGDMALGPADAKVTIIEYASMTCPHCADFHKEVYPKLKAQYIDTGKVRFIFREFPLDIKAAAGSMLARCVGKDNAQKYFAVVDILFDTQEDWAVKDTTAALKRIGKQAGMSEQGVEACLASQPTLDGIKATQDYAVDKLKVNSTPTFFVNGTMLKGGASLEDFAKLIDPVLADAQPDAKPDTKN
jgi:protein-disulfide isomerase